MIHPKTFTSMLEKQKIAFFTGVPDSLLKDLCAFITDHFPAEQHIIAANEGNALAIATGYYLATSRIPAVYMQNSGLGNIVNPLTSLASADVYSIPILLIIGWRSGPGVKDEPQHKQMGRIQNDLLKVLEVPYTILGDDIEKAFTKARRHFKEHASPYAFVVPKGTFEEYILQKTNTPSFELSREEALTHVLTVTESHDSIVSTTGKTSRELFELREKRGEGHEQDFLCVGNMGHTSSLALGVAIGQPNRRVWCFDGDGSVIMHMGATAIIGQQQPKNFMHVLFNNFAHDSVGGQPTASESIDFQALAKACGYRYVLSSESAIELRGALQKLIKLKGPTFLEIRCNKGSRKDLGRPTISPAQNKRAFMIHLKK